jgi:hypothetical protein
VFYFCCCLFVVRVTSFQYLDCKVITSNSEIIYYPFNAERLIKTSRSEPFKIKIPSKNTSIREKPTNTPIIHLVY